MRDGLILIDKASGGTSHNVVQKVRRILSQKKIGHCGTLDPSATGLLVLTLGKATRLTRFLIRAPKVYSGTIRFGYATDTYDAEGETTREASVEGLTEEKVLAGMPSFVGTYPQAAPAYSAKKIKGKKFYELAREGDEVAESKEEVAVFSFDAAGPYAGGALPFQLGCSSGTYVRVVAHELGEAVDSAAHLASLHRDSVGPFKNDQAISIDDLADLVAANGAPPAAWVPFDEIPLPFARVETDAQQERRITNGQTVLLRQGQWEEGDWVKLVNRRQAMIAVGTVVERLSEGRVGLVQPKIVFK